MPGTKPITDAGVGMLADAGADDCAPSTAGVASAQCAATIAMRRSARVRSLDVDLAELVGGLEHVADLTREGARLDGRAVDVADG